MNELRVRLATTADDDAGALAEVYRSAYRENRELGFPAKAESATEEEVAEWIREHRVYVAEVDEAGNEGEEESEGEAGSEDEEGNEDEEGSEARIVGGVRLEETDPDRVKLSRLGVHDEWKGQGVGSELLDRAEEAVRDWGHTTVWLTTPEDHPYLLDLYRGRGYEVTEPYPLEYREYDEVVVEKQVR